MEILFVASTAVIAPDPAESRRLYLDDLGLPLQVDDGYAHGAVEGSKHFGVWPLAQAARSCFGTDEWPADRPVPQASIEFDVAGEDEVRAAEGELVEAGHDLLHATKTEPWGQTVVRFQTKEGVILGISYTPQMH